MKYREFLPSPHFQDIISNYWQFEVPEREDRTAPIHHETLPENMTTLVLINDPHFQGIRILGPQLKKFQRPIFPPAFYFGIRFQPWVIVNDIFPDKIQLINQAIDLSPRIASFFSKVPNSILKPGFSNISLIEDCLAKMLSQTPIAKNELVKFICLELEKGKPVGAIVEKIPLSIRPIQKQFKSVTGITMKQYANILRMQKTWREMVVEKKEYLEVILENGYYDQAHFINSFKKAMNSSHNAFFDYHAMIDISLS